MYQTINLHDFRNAFQEIRPSNFTYEGLETLFDYITMIEDEDNQFELDVIGFCCAYSEMTLQEIIDNYNIIIDLEKPLITQIHVYLTTRTIVCGITSVDTIVFQQF
jgi:hypothetical protein